MKYRYRDNWLREVKMIFLIRTEDLLSLVPTDKYEVVYFSHYVLPFTYQRVKNDFGIKIKDNTHLQLLLKRREMMVDEWVDDEYDYGDDYCYECGGYGDDYFENENEN